MSECVRAFVCVCMLVGTCVRVCLAEQGTGGQTECYIVRGKLSVPDFVLIKFIVKTINLLRISGKTSRKHSDNDTFY